MQEAGQGEPWLDPLRATACWGGEFCPRSSALGRHRASPAHLSSLLQKQEAELGPARPLLSSPSRKDLLGTSIPSFVGKGPFLLRLGWGCQAANSPLSLELSVKQKVASRTPRPAPKAMEHLLGWAVGHGQVTLDMGTWALPGTPEWNSTFPPTHPGKCCWLLPICLGQGGHLCAQPLIGSSSPLCTEHEAAAPLVIETSLPGDGWLSGAAWCGATTWLWN